MTQIMNLLLLAPDIQEALLFLPPSIEGRDPVTERTIRQVLTCRSFVEQRHVCARKLYPALSYPSMVYGMPRAIEESWCR